MKALRNYLDKIKPNFEEGGKFLSLIHIYRMGGKSLLSIRIFRLSRKMDLPFWSCSSVIQCFSIPVRAIST